MMLIQRVATLLAVSGGLTLVASAQSPAPTAGQIDPNSPAGVAAQQERDALRLSVRRTSIVQHYPYPYPGYYQGDRSAGFRNPGGGGRYLEYYPPGGQFQVSGEPIGPATFDQGGGHPSPEQMQAQQIGIQKENAIMNHIDRMARPYYGYGFGAGYFGGFY